MRYFLTLVLSLLSVTKAMMFCQSPEDFDKNNAALRERLIKALKPANSEKLLLHKIMLYNSIAPDKDNTTIRRIKIDDEEIEIRERIVIEDKDQEFYDNEFDYRSGICMLPEDVSFHKLSDCKSNAVIKFVGCVLYGKSLFIFQEPMELNIDLGRTDAALKYKYFSGQAKAKIMLDIIAKFEKLHARNIIHGNIQPSNLVMKQLDFVDIKIINFELAGNPGEITGEGNAYFIPPEKRETQELSIDYDIYSLAVTFANFELEMQRYELKNENSHCFDEDIEVTEDCIANYRTAVLGMFNNDNQTALLADVMEKAMDLEPSNRFQSMKLFGDAIGAVLEKLPSVANTKGANRVLSEMEGVGSKVAI